MSTNNKTKTSEAIASIDEIKNTIKEQSKETLASLLKESVQSYMRETIEGADTKEDDVEKDYEIQDDKIASENDSENDANQTDEGNETDSDSETSDELLVDDETDASETDSEDTDVPSDEGSDEWSQFDDYNVGNDTYDLTGAKDASDVIKVYKLLKDTDNVVIKKNDDNIKIQDNETGAEYVIELESDEEEPSFEIDVDESADAIAGFPYNESKKKRKTMKENKEMVFEIDLGYTDSYQKEDPIKGLSDAETSKYNYPDKGIKKGTSKPWAGDAKAKSAPYGKSVNEEDITAPVTEEPVTGLEEGGARTSVKKRHKVKSATNVGNPQIASPIAPNSDNGKLNESLVKKIEKVLAENKQLKSNLVKANAALQEALMVNVNLGKITKLFMENTTTKNEKIDIVNRFSNEAKTMEQSNTLYESIDRELKKANKKAETINESSMVANDTKINETPLYESQDLLDMKSLMTRMAKY